MPDIDWLDDEENGQCIAHIDDLGFVEVMQIGSTNSWTARALHDVGRLVLTDLECRELDDAKDRSLELWDMLSEMLGAG